MKAKANLHIRPKLIYKTMEQKMAIRGILYQAMTDKKWTQEAIAKIEEAVKSGRDVELAVPMELGEFNG